MFSGQIKLTSYNGLIGHMKKMLIEQKNKLIFILLSLIFLLGAVFVAFSFNQGIEGPGSCKLCHKMVTYEASFENPGSGSIIGKHKLTCLQCHTNNSMKESRDMILKMIILTRILPLDGFSPTPGEINATLDVNCRRCHAMSDSRHSFEDTVDCKNCHWAHSSPSLKVTTMNASIIPNGPHINRSCFECHGTGFEIPSCIKCHTGHGEDKWDNTLCLNCHKDAHIPSIPGIPLNYTDRFRGVLPMETCKPCHEEEYYIASYSLSRHSINGTCTECHFSHRIKPSCDYVCHTVMSGNHPEFFCNRCHKEDYKKVTCFDCHGTEEHDMIKSNAFWNPK